jgi:hypothetical protein
MLTAILAGAVALPSVAAASQQSPLSAGLIVKRLNTERARQGLPSAVQEVPVWSDRCTAHNRWMSLNEVSHDEPAGTEGYTDGGAWAGANSVLAQGTNWRAGNPWTDAPLHLIQLLNPDLRRAGASDAYGGSCVTTWPGFAERRGRRVYTMPRNGGHAPTSELAFEAPFTPQERVGIAADVRTGPYLYVWTDGYRALVDGYLLDPDGNPVDTQVIDNTDVDGIAGEGNGWLLPVEPLQPRTKYTATVLLKAADGEVAHTWSFTTT